MIKLGLVRLSVARKDDGGQVFIFEHLGIPVIMTRRINYDSSGS
jgi:hypothetical protein